MPGVEPASEVGSARGEFEIGRNPIDHRECAALCSDVNATWGAEFARTQIWLSPKGRHTALCLPLV